MAEAVCPHPHVSVYGKGEETLEKSSEGMTSRDPSHLIGMNLVTFSHGVLKNVICNWIVMCSVKTEMSCLKRKQALGTSI